MNISSYNKIPSRPIAYWISSSMISAFENPSLSKFADASVGMISGDNERFLRLWHEVNFAKACFDATDYLYAVYTGKKWFPLQKGGNRRYWYGNLEYLINYEKDGYDLKNNNNDKNGRVKSHNYNGPRAFQPGITWNSIGTSDIITRISETGFIYDAGGPLCTIKKPENTYFFLGLLFSKTAQNIYQFINPTINYTPGTLLSLPVIMTDQVTITEVNLIVQDNIVRAKKDWDSFETSWNFKKHPLI